ncbi:Bug family tripartite tricarboxylate transporter substrate binding protein [Achromobacter aloeverae]|uniref:Bug family tripartite tricarboxylate transporter substrate binding protein n=1 Tax=Achromobacter aloeverae TaxID=1750518 RepID=UPI0013014771|nr:tripartite tricarboxylate transporter substrate-binding protein [Achromobacter aloeverae]
MGLLVVAGNAFPFAALSSDEVIEVYPTRPITLVVGFPPGGGVDAVARQMATHLTQELGQSVIVTYRPGAAGNIGAAAVARAAPDGYTVYMAVRPVALHKTLFKGVDYDFATDLVPVGMVVGVPYVLAMGKHVAAASLQAGFVLARSHPHVFTCASPGMGSTNHLLCEDLKEKASVPWVHVPYKGEASMLVDLIAGRADFAVVSVPAALPYIASDSIRPMAVFANARVSAIPSVPRVEEHGYGSVQAQGWCALMAPAGTPAHVITRLNRSINAALSNVEVRRKLVRLGYVMPEGGNAPEALEKFLAEDTERWTRMLEQRQITGLQ